MSAAGGAQTSAARAAVAVAGTLALLKLGAYFATGSVAMLSSLVDSALDGGASLLILLAVSHAQVPPDEDHRFGHGKAEALAGLGQAAFITASGLYLMIEAASRFVRPTPVEQGVVGIAVMIVSIVLTLFLVRYQRKVARETGSLAISSDALHYLSDLLANVGVIAAIVLSTFFGLWWADPLFAVAVALWILRAAWEIGGGAWDQLMDREAPEAQREEITAAVLKVPGVRGVHDLRTRISGPHFFVQMHVDMDGRLSLREAHAIAERVAQSVRAAVPEAEVLVHEDPV